MASLREHIKRLDVSYRVLRKKNLQISRLNQTTHPLLTGKGVDKLMEKDRKCSRKSNDRSGEENRPRDYPDSRKSSNGRHTFGPEQRRKALHLHLFLTTPKKRIESSEVRHTRACVRVLKDRPTWRCVADTGDTALHAPTRANDARRLEFLPNAGETVYRTV